MTCDEIKVPGGHAIVCSRGRRRRRKCDVCDRASVAQCDADLGRGRTCDRHLCDIHATAVGPDLDLCPTHATNPPARQLELLDLGGYSDGMLTSTARAVADAALGRRKG